MHNLSVKEMDKGAAQASAFLSALASPHRLRILCQLAEGEKSVSQIMAATDIAQTSMSQHLGKLKEEGIVTFRREHRTLYYRIHHPLALDIMSSLYGYFCDTKRRKK